MWIYADVKVVGSPLFIILLGDSVPWSFQRPGARSVNLHFFEVDHPFKIPATGQHDRHMHKSISYSWLLKTFDWSLVKIELSHIRCLSRTTHKLIEGFHQLRSNRTVTAQSVRVAIGRFERKTSTSVAVVVWLGSLPRTNHFRLQHWLTCVRFPGQ